MRLCLVCLLATGASKKCEICQEDKPAASPLTLSITVPCHAVYSHTPLLLEQQKPNLTFGFLRDILEARTGIPDAKMMVLWKDEIVDGDAADRVVDILRECNPHDVLTLTLHHADKLSGDSSSSSSSSQPRGSPVLGRKKSSRSKGAPGGPPGGSSLSRQGSTEKARKSPDGDDDSGMMVDDAGGWGDDAAGDDDGWGDENDDGEWGGEDDGDDDGGQSAPVDDGDMKESDMQASPRKVSTAPASSSSAAAAAASSSSAASSAAAAASMDTSSSSSSTYESVYAKTHSYILRKPSHLEQHVRVLCEDLGEVLGLSADEAAILLRNSKDRWNRARIEEAWMEDSEKAREIAGLGPEADPDADTDETRLVECETCCDELPAKQTLALTCKHRFCDTVSAMRAE